MNVLDTKETAKLLRVSVSTIRKLVDSDSIPHFRVASRLYFNEDSLKQWIKEQEAEHCQKQVLSQQEIKSFKNEKILCATASQR